MAPLSDQQRRDLLEILEDRYDRRSTLIAAQLPIKQWHDMIGDPTFADTILDLSTGSFTTLTKSI